MEEKRGDMRSRILYEDKEVLVAHKPAGIAVQTARTGQADVVSELKNYLCQGRGGLCMATGRQEPYLGIIHRLDQPVEGLLVFAKTRRSAASLTGQLQRQGDEGSFCKRYYAVLCGIPAAREGRLEDCLYKQPVKNGKRTDYISVIKEAGPEMRDSAEGSGRSESSACPEGRGCPESRSGRQGHRRNAAGDPAPGSKSRPGDRQRLSAAAKEPRICRAVLEYRILQTREEQGLALADIGIDTGRFHQIRAQMAHAGTPLLGDSKYGNERTKALAQTLGVRNVALCAYRLGFLHPVSGKEMNFQIKPENPAFSSFSQL